LPVPTDKIKIKNPIITVPFRYGILAATISIILFIILYFAGKNPLLIPPFLDFRIILYPIILVFAIRDFKENKNEGTLHFWQGMSVGLQAMVISSFLVAVFILIFGSFVEPRFVPEYIRLMTEQIKGLNENVVESVGKEAIDKSLELLSTTNIFDLAIDYFIKSLPYGVFLTIIISLILRKKTF
jgi:hypothetical protein